MRGEGEVARRGERLAGASREDVNLCLFFSPHMRQKQNQVFSTSDVQIKAAARRSKTAAVEGR